MINAPTSLIIDFTKSNPFLNEFVIKSNIAPESDLKASTKNVKAPLNISFMNVITSLIIDFTKSNPFLNGYVINSNNVSTIDLNA